MTLVTVTCDSDSTSTIKIPPYNIRKAGLDLDKDWTFNIVTCKILNLEIHSCHARNPCSSPFRFRSDPYSNPLVSHLVSSLCPLVPPMVFHSGLCFRNPNVLQFPWSHPWWIWPQALAECIGKWKTLLLPQSYLPVLGYSGTTWLVHQNWSYDSSHHLNIS